VQRNAKINLDRLLPFVEAGAKVVAINPTCSMMLRREYPELVAGEDRERAQRLAEAVVDPSELLWSIRKEQRFNTDFKSQPSGPIAYHAPCHLRALGVGFRGRDVIRKAFGVKVGSVMECCGQDGTWSMTVDGFEPANRVGQKAFEGMQEVGAELWVSDCPLAHGQFEQNTGVRPLHPMTVLARAYRGEPFGPGEPAGQSEEP
jgi:Fe-S oxidoreductase